MGFVSERASLERALESGARVFIGGKRTNGLGAYSIVVELMASSLAAAFLYSEFAIVRP
jgi:hypothetical protein